jgi:predicted component of type VI protein secretion system
MGEGAGMTSQELGDVLLHHWQLLWPLPASERIKRIDEIKADLIFQAELEAVSIEMSNPEFV